MKQTIAIIAAIVVGLITTPFLMGIAEGRAGAYLAAGPAIIVYWLINRDW